VNGRHLGALLTAALLAAMALALLFGLALDGPAPMIVQR
jgi:hypothetical protein